MERHIPHTRFPEAVWTSKLLEDNGTQEFIADIELPKQGYKAFYAETIYPSPLGDEYSKCTRMYVVDSAGVLE